MRRTRTLMAGTLVLAAAVLAGCSAAATPAPTPPPTQAPATQAPATQAPTANPTVEAKSVATIGTVLVASSNGMTVYYFATDVKDSGKSACSGGCITKWPALTVPAGGTPVAGSGVTAKLGTITRDDGTLQVTYNGLPLYFYSLDKVPGDATGVYTNWTAVKP